MSPLFKRVIFIINFMFSIAFIFHVSWIIFLIVHPPLPEVEVSKEDLRDLEFPLVFRICAFELFGNTERYENVGYSDYWEFFNGNSMYNSELFGWSGFTEDNTTIATVEGK